MANYKNSEQLAIYLNLKYYISDITSDNVTSHSTADF